MARDFFQQQDRARRNTTRLIFLFVLAVICITLLVYALVLALAGMHDAKAKLWQPELFGLTMLGVGSLVGLSSLYKISQLASGGETVALMMGCTKLPNQTRDITERRLLNIVEEMAIAAGVPVPPVYVMEEEGINAFAAGYAPGDAVVAVSRGCLKYLNRDELQGVVAHEFSHILNGDMRLNIRLIGWIFGILALAVIGRILLESSMRSSRSSSKNDGRGLLLLIGVGLLVIGSVGAFFARIIQAAISREREYLADASAVQFTRNPEGIAGALKKIGGLQASSRIANPEAMEISHMFFANAFTGGFANLFATHPPLVQRIRMLDPHFDGKFPVVRPIDEQAIREEEQSRSRRKEGTGGLRIPGFPQMPLPIPIMHPAQAADRVGRLRPPIIQEAQNLGEEFPMPLRLAAEEPFAARALVFCLLLDTRPDVRNAQLARLGIRAKRKDIEQTNRLADQVQALPDRLRLPLLDLALPSLRQMSPQQHAEFREMVEDLIQADQRVSLFEYALRCVLHRHLDAQFQPKSADGPTQTMSTEDAVTTVLALLAWHGDPQAADPPAAFAAGIKVFFGDAANREPPDKLSVAGFDRALKSLALASPDQKRRVINACAACILTDHHVAVREIELLRAICDMLDSPMPLLVPEPANPT